MMGFLHDLFRKVRPEEEAVELPEEEEVGRQVTVRIETLKDFVDIDRVSRLLKDGNIIFLKAKELQRTDLGEFQNCIQKLKRVCTQYGWDIVGTEEGYLVVTPQFAKIER